MTDEQTRDDAEASEQPQAEAAPEETPAAEDTGEPAEQEGAPADAEGKPAEESEKKEEAEESATPKQLRKRRRSAFKGTAGEPRTTAERAAERTRLRTDKAATRRRWRRKSRERGTAAPEPAAREPTKREPGRRKTRQGVVVSSKAQKTIAVRIDHFHRHRTYGKVVHESATLYVHDERDEANEGDTVRIVECRPLSRSKRWRLVEILERAK